MVTVILTEAEIELCQRAAEARMAFGAAHGLNHACLMQRAPHERHAHELGGAASELAMAKWLGIEGYQPSVQYVKDAVDVEPDIEVRSTGWMNGHLCVRQRDHAARRYVLAITALLRDYQQVRLAGWMLGSDAMNERYVQTYYGKPEYWVPWRDLQPMHAFRKAENGTV